MTGFLKNEDDYDDCYCIIGAKQWRLSRRKSTENPQRGNLMGTLEGKAQGDTCKNQLVETSKECKPCEDNQRSKRCGDMRTGNSMETPEGQANWDPFKDKAT